MTAQGQGIAPVLRWAGSKRQLLTDLRYYWPPRAKRYIEPFCGSACLFFDVAPSRAILGDINGDLISAYRALRDNPSSVWQHYRKFSPTKREFYKLRRKSATGLSKPASAARFLFLNRYCFNGLYRTNRRGQFNVPCGGRKQAKIRRSTLLNAAPLLRRATFVAGDFKTTLTKVRSGDFVYLDPPYALETRRIFSDYHKDGFSTQDLHRLCEELHRITHRGAWFLLSYADTPATRHMFEDWFTRRIVARRNIAGFTGNRRRAYELLVSNFPLPR